MRKKDARRQTLEPATGRRGWARERLWAMAFGVMKSANGSLWLLEADQCPNSVTSDRFKQNSVIRYRYSLANYLVTSGTIANDRIWLTDAAKPPRQILPLLIPNSPSPRQTRSSSAAEGRSPPGNHRRHGLWDRRDKLNDHYHHDDRPPTATTSTTTTDIEPWVWGVGEVDLGDGYALGPCSGDADQFACIFRNGSVIGSAEHLALPVDAFDLLDGVDDPAGSIELIAADYVSTFTCDSESTCPNLEFMSLVPTTSTIGGSEGLRYGFEELDGERVVEKNVIYGVRGDETIDLFGFSANRRRGLLEQRG